MNTQKTPKPNPAEWMRFESAIDAILKSKPIHRKVKPAKKNPVNHRIPACQTE